MLYLLHFDQPVGRKQHYLGCTTEDRLGDRLREHAAGKGASLTKRVLDAGVPIYLARVFPEMSWEREKIVKVQSHFNKICPLCCPLLERMKGPAVELRRPPATDMPERAVWDWRSRPNSG